MKTLILYYSRTGTTKKLAEKLANSLSADIEEVSETINRSGARGYLLSGRDAAFKKLTKINPISHNLSEYDLVVIGTPVWAWTMSSPIRTLITEQKDNIKKVAFFCTQGGEGNQGALPSMAKLIGKDPLASLSLLTKEVIGEKPSDFLNDFINKL